MGSTSAPMVVTWVLFLSVVVVLLSSLCQGFTTTTTVPLASFGGRNRPHRSMATTKTSGTVTTTTTTTRNAFSTFLCAQPQHPEFSLVNEENDDDSDEHDDDVDDDDDDDEVYEYEQYDDHEEEDDDEDEDTEPATSLTFRQRKFHGNDLLIVNDDALSRQTSTDIDRSPNVGSASTYNYRSKNYDNGSHIEYGALRPGTVVQVQIGDLQLARKAWKKRRRSGSPLLVPCSILNVDRQSMVLWNLIFLLEKFGRETSPSKSKNGDDRAIEFSVASLARVYRTYLKSSLKRQVEALGFKTGEDMVRSILNKKVQESYGIHLEERTESSGKDGTMLYLTAPISRQVAQRRVANAPLMQFRFRPNDESSDPDTLIHTGYVRGLKDESEDREYGQFPLSAAVRVSQKQDLDSGRVTEGSIHAAVVFDYDKIGDGGSPLLTLSLDPGTIREKLKIKVDRRLNIIPRPKILLNELVSGDGPFDAKVVALLNNRAVVDLGVGRELASVGFVQVYGSLYFKDSVAPVKEDENESFRKKDSFPFVEFDDEDDEDINNIITTSLDELYMLDDDEDDDDDFDEEEDFDDDEIDVEDEEDGMDDIAKELLALRKDSYTEEDEIEEDISYLFETDKDGNLMYKDPESGELTMLEEGTDIEESDGGDDDDVSLDMDFEGKEFEQRVFEGEYDDVPDDVMASLFTENEDGSLTYHDPDTGETMVVSKDDSEYQDMMMVKSLIDDYLPKGGNKSKKASSVPLQSMTESNRDEEKPSRRNPKPKLMSKRLKVGEYVKVYVKTVSKSSSTFRVTTNPLIKGQKPKQIKKEAEIEKKLKRLKEKVGGNLNNIYSLEGNTCDGVVKAHSKTGDWFYVQPLYKNKDLPVGVATIEGEELEDLSPGDFVQVRIGGIDFDRGQLALHVLKKLRTESKPTETKRSESPKTFDISSGKENKTIGRLSKAKGKDKKAATASNSGA
jgi:hypothetical protein